MDIDNRKCKENKVDKQTNLKINDLISKAKEKVMVKQSNSKTKDLNSSKKKVNQKQMLTILPIIVIPTRVNF